MKKIMTDPPTTSTTSNTPHTNKQIGWAGAPSYPGWNLTRPYLTGDFLGQPHRHAAPVPASLAHRFNSSTSSQSSPPPLGQFPKPAQERLLVEDLLWAVTGYEGRYVKAAAPSSSSAIDPNSSSSSMGMESAAAAAADAGEAPVEFVLGEEAGVDPSLAAMARKFLPLAGYCVRVRRFIEVKRRCVLVFFVCLCFWGCFYTCMCRRRDPSTGWLGHNQPSKSHPRPPSHPHASRYDYGMVAQALAAGLASVLREYLVQVAQLEHRHQQEPQGA